MEKNPRALLEEFHEGMKISLQTKDQEEKIKSFMSFSKNVHEKGVLDPKTKSLIACALSVQMRCEYCIVYHVHQALKTGATGSEIMDAAMTSVTFGGGSSLAYAITLLRQAVEEFEKDF